MLLPGIFLTVFTDDDIIKINAGQTKANGFLREVREVRILQFIVDNSQYITYVCVCVAVVFRCLGTV
jgi:hypothetical protein